MVSAAMHEARTHRRALARAAHGWTGEAIPVEDLPGDYQAQIAERTGRSAGKALVTAEERTSGVVIELDCRPTRWSLDLADVARRLSVCESGRALRRRPTGDWECVTLGCGVRLCPVCARLRAARTAARWRPVLEAAIDDGAELRHWTLTHRTETAPGGVVTPIEVDRYRWHAGGDVRAADWVECPDGEWRPPVSVAVGGESLRSAYDRLRGRVRKLREDRGSRAIVRTAWSASILGVEWTGREPRTGVPRWHAHAHVLTVSRRPLESVEVRAVLAAWQGKRGRGLAGDRSQRSRIIAADGIAEVLKYPFKPGALTGAQRVEVLAAARGQKPHQVGGAFHAQSALHTEEPWSKWLACRPEPEWRPRLHLVPRLPDERMGAVAAGAPVLFTGQVDTDDAAAPHTWAIRRDGEWERWVGPAAPYLRAIGAPSDESELPEPGDDDE